MKLEGRVSLITGSAQGIGKEIAMTFAQAGSDIVVCDVNLETAQKTQKEIESLGRRALSFKVDVTNAKEVEEMYYKEMFDEKCNSVKKLWQNLNTVCSLNNKKARIALKCLLAKELHLLTT